MISLVNIEDIVCAAVNDGVGREVVSHGDIFLGKTKVPFAVLLARQFFCYALHDMFHLSYKVISEHTGLSRRNVLRNVNKVRLLFCDDKLYAAILGGITERLKDS